jgi:diacylglycerol kinase
MQGLVPKLSGMRGSLLAFVNSWQGFKGAFRFEAAFRQEVALAVVLLPLGAGSARRAREGAAGRSVLLVLIVELLNTGIETVVDRIGLERMSCPAWPRTWAPPPCCYPSPCWRDLGLPAARLTRVRATG